MVALTFDDGPNPEYTPKILDTLKENNIKATFFVLGKHVEEYPELAKRIVDEGHDIGSHSYSHARLFPNRERKIIDEIDLTDKIITGVTGKKPAYFRPPYGIFDERARKILVDRNYTVVLWSLTSYDWAAPKEGVLFRQLRKAKAGDIILLHDSGGLIKAEGGNRKSTVEAIPEIIDILKEKNLKPVKISEMIDK